MIVRLAWYARRLSRMTPVEIVGRIRDQAVRWRLRRRRLRSAAADRLVLPPEIPPFATPLPSLEIENISGGARDRVIEAADAVLAGRWQVFDREREDMYPAPDWFFDPLTGRHAPHDSYAFDINCRDEYKVGNIKYVWELSRHHHLTLLATAFYLSGDDRYAECVALHLRSWWHENPFLSGVHWTSGIELGIRLIS